MMKAPFWRLAGALSTFSAWLVLLFSGYTFGGALHLLLAAAAWLTPWSAIGEER